MTHPLKPGYSCVLETFSAAAAGWWWCAVTNRVIYDAAGTGRSCQNDNNRVKMSATATTESSGATTVNVIDDLFDY